MISEEARRYLPQDTPEWILRIIDAGPHGGWFTPFEVGQGHPLVEEGWLCLYCEEFFEPGQVAFVQPLMNEGKWTATHRDCMAKALGIADLLEMSPLERFYRGRGLDGQGRSFEVSLAMSDEDWEAGHNHIQWMFGLPEPSRMQPDSPVMTAKDIEVFRTDTEIGLNIQRAFDRWMSFLGKTSRWKRTQDHNHLRITRVLRFLTLMGLNAEADQLLTFATENHPSLPERTARFWREACNEHPAWLDG
jgi:hypothetical protein